jgi:hypothetical protein
LLPPENGGKRLQLGREIQVVSITIAIVFTSVATIKSYHKLGGLKYQKFILSRFWRPEVQNQLSLDRSEGMD